MVVSQDGRRHLGVIVKLHRAGSGEELGAFLRPAYTGVDGRYRFDGLAPGCYRVVVDAPAGTAFPAERPGGDQIGLDDLVTCVDGGGSSGNPATSTELRSVTEPEVTEPEVTEPEATEPTTDADDASTGTDDEATAVATDPVESRTIELVHLGHHLGQLQPMTIDLEVEGATVETEVGGWPRVVAAIEEARPADAPESTITVNTGGVLAGSPLSHLFGGAADAALLHQACFDYLAPSPEDQARADEWEVFRHFLDDAPCPTTVLDPAGPPRSNAAIDDPAIALHAVGDGVVGLVAVEADPTGASDPVAATVDRVEQLIDLEVTTIVVLSGLGLRADRGLAAQLPEVDAIIGSGAGSLLGAVDDLGLTTGGPYPDEERNADGNPVCLGHAGARAMAIGVLRLELDGSGRVIDCAGEVQLLVGRYTIV
ncbi:MAG: hypothetical protein AAFO29_23065, partial [Actinomycetota bacterium]